MPTNTTTESFTEKDRKYGRFGEKNGIVYFPVWFPALLHALVDIAALQAYVGVRCDRF